MSGVAVVVLTIESLLGVSVPCGLLGAVSAWRRDRVEAGLLLYIAASAATAAALLEVARRGAGL